VAKGGNFSKRWENLGATKGWGQGAIKSKCVILGPNMKKMNSPPLLESQPKTWGGESTELGKTQSWPKKNQGLGQRELGGGGGGKGRETTTDRKTVGVCSKNPIPK